MNHNMVIGISIAVVLITILLFLIRRDIIVFMYPHRTIGQHHTTHSKQTITLWYWKESHWNRETTNVVWSQLQSECIKTIINTLLTLLQEEEVLSIKASVQSVALNESETYAYVSCDRSFLHKEMATETKLMIIESILKTLKENAINVQHIQFLVHHEPMNDHHLDLSRPWPINGFCDTAHMEVS